jgi:hypothetical protein
VPDTLAVASEVSVLPATPTTIDTFVGVIVLGIGTLTKHITPVTIAAAPLVRAGSPVAASHVPVGAIVVKFEK